MRWNRIREIGKGGELTVVTFTGRNGFIVLRDLMLERFGGTVEIVRDTPTSQSTRLRCEGDVLATSWGGGFGIRVKTRSAGGHARLKELALALDAIEDDQRPDVFRECWAFEAKTPAKRYPDVLVVAIGDHLVLPTTREWRSAAPEPRDASTHGGIIALDALTGEVDRADALRFELRPLRDSDYSTQLSLEAAPQSSELVLIERNFKEAAFAGELMPLDTRRHRLDVSRFEHAESDLESATPHETFDEPLTALEPIRAFVCGDVWVAQQRSRFVVIDQVSGAEWSVPGTFVNGWWSRRARQLVLRTSHLFLSVKLVR